MRDTLNHEPRFNETAGDVIAELKDEMRDLAADIAATPTDQRGPLLTLLDRAGNLLTDVLKGQAN